MKGSFEFSMRGETDRVVIEFNIDDGPEIEITNISDIEDYIARNLSRWDKSGEVETWGEPPWHYKL